MSNANFDNDDDAVKLSLLYMIFYIPLSNANSVKIDLKFFALADNLDDFNDFPWGVFSWEATRATTCNTVENMMFSKRIPLKKSDKIHYSIAGFPHSLLVWAHETLPSIASKFTTKYDQAIPCMLSWITADNVKFDDVRSAFTAVGENQEAGCGEGRRRRKSEGGGVQGDRILVRDKQGWLKFLEPHLEGNPAVEGSKKEKGKVGTKLANP
ncbi:hypothetical protein TIFTF001_031370 [Ficus carica]|uniref:DUF1985 domain-containing protein n=1 Tax=Ficus carica TaxID=3494 RepID=A0AA88DUX3_FICCA|nr:hypothetical protein TIFTF001_031370 [Ficus carica]